MSKKIFVQIGIDRRGEGGLDGYQPFLLATSAAWALALFNVAVFSSELKSFLGVGPGTFGPEEVSTTGAGLGASGAAGTSSAFGVDCSRGVIRKEESPRG